MIGIFCSSNIKDNTQLKRKLKVQNVIMLLLMMVGIAVIVATVLYKNNGGTFLNGVSPSFYYGVGSGVIAGAAVLTIKNTLTMKSEQKLTRMRINITDERNIAINSASIKVAVAVMLAAAFAILLISGIWTIRMPKAIFCLIMLFLASYCVSYKIISSRI